MENGTIDFNQCRACGVAAKVGVSKWSTTMQDHVSHLLSRQMAVRYRRKSPPQLYNLQI